MRCVKPRIRGAAIAGLIAEQVPATVPEPALKIYDGVGYTQARDLEGPFRDSLSFHFEEGAEEIQRLLIARRLLRLPFNSN